MDIEDVRRRLMLSISGALAVGCGPSVPPSDGEDGTTGVVAGSSSATASASATSTSGTNTEATTQADADADDTSSPKYDISREPDAPPFVPPKHCPPQPMPPLEECTAELPDVMNPVFLFYCVDIPADGSCDTWVQDFEAHYHETWPGWITECREGEVCSGTAVLEIGCGPLPDYGDQCCFWFGGTETQFCPGRPFVVAGRERLAELVERDDWAADVPLSAAASSAQRAAIAAAWAEQALFEHASIASFSRFILQLLACGAPAQLLRAAQVALGEEIEHARLFFAFASRYAGHPVGPTALATHDALAASDDFDEIVLSTVREGCIAETISAWHVTLAAKSARNPAMAAALARVAEQELEHAALAWSFLAWALPRASDSLRRRVEATLHAPARHAPRGPTLAPTALSNAEWLAHGILSTREHAAATQHALRELVVPLARSLPNASAARPPHRAVGVT